ncbi:RNA polymerase sigma factor [Humisphaera borealis]|uniref:Sigma-70 family RNA polymerase sigma factor n=1 Tax=Humisphaera borealis TaxID=2807512 RepID=A0A7M2WS94_9BACT|nr:sigma-70 family RNA polymerase sigma factor [Humisphaera borealis]QOV88378.1 sigma-70 family RNA polymerase sigma factor [Humisphaera borealis]
MPIQTFILANGSRLLQYIRKIFPTSLRASYDPLDVYQTAVFEAFRRAPQFRHINNDATMGWLRLIARRQIGMTLRRERHRLLAATADAPAGSGPTLRLLEEYATYLRTPSKSAMRREILRAVEQTMESLPAHLREAVRLKHIEGLGMAEVAARINRTEAAAATLCYRGLRLLKRKLRSFSQFA